MRSILIGLILCALPVVGAAQDRTAVSGPVSGFVFDQAGQALRPVVGVPGAAYLGAPVLGSLDAAAVSPDGSAALAVIQGRVFLVTGLNAEPAATAIEGAIEGAGRFAWAQDGSSAAVYAPASGRAQLLRDLGKTPQAGETLDLAGLGPVSALACTGDAILLGVAAEDGGGIYLATAGAAPRLVASAAKPAGIAVAGRDIYFADQERGQVWQVRDVAGDATPLLFAEGLQGPVGVQLAGGRLFVANAGDSSLETFDVAARASAGRLALDAAPATLEAFGSRSLWLLNAAGAAGDPLYVLDAGAAPAVYFVPAGREE